MKKPWTSCDAGALFLMGIQGSSWVHNLIGDSLADKPQKMMSQKMIDCNDGACYWLPQL